MNFGRIDNICFHVVVLGSLLASTLLVADDWPTWRKDATRSASSSDVLPANLNLQWSRHYEAPRPAWLGDPRLLFDASYYPVVAGKSLFLASAQTNSVTSLDTDNGKQKWRFFAEGPVRFAPIVHAGRVYFGSDDGFLYCLDAQTGSLAWKLNAAPNRRKVIGNDRLISVWPVRGGPVLHQDKIYFCAGVWPFEGTFLYEVDLKSELVPPAFVSHTLPEDMLPQGYLAAADDAILIPCGRGKVRKYLLSSRQLKSIKYDSRAKTDYHVTSSGKYMFHGGKVVDLAGNRELAFQAPQPVSRKNVIFSSIKNRVIGGIDLENPVVTEKKNKDGKLTKSINYAAWSFPLDLGRDAKDNPVPVTVALVSNNRIYGYSNKFVFALDPASETSPNPKVRPKLVWKQPVKGTPSSMLVADEKLFVTTKEGDIHCFSGSTTVARDWPKAPGTLPKPNDRSLAVTNMLDDARSTEGYCLVLGLNNGHSVSELLRQSKMRILVIDKDPVRINAFRHNMTDLGFYGNRVEAYVGDIMTTNLPPYLANLVVSEDWSRAGLDRGPKVIHQIYAAVRPYGGTACFEIPDNEKTNVQAWAKDLPKAEIRKLNEFVSVTRSGKLPGAGDWTDEYGNPANTLMSSDKLVKSPFGVLWFGGPAAHPDLFYDRHLWASSAIIIHGRMFIQGPQKLTAVDVYTGRILWQIPLKKGLSPGRRANWASTGFHFLATADRVYLTYEKVCMVLDAATGIKTTEIKLPDPKYGIGRIRIWNDLLIIPSFTNHKEFGPVPTRIFALNRFDGKQVWKIDTPQSFPFIAIGKEKMFVFEGLLAKLYDNSKRAGNVPKSAPEKFLGAFDLKTGERIWKQPTKRVVTWLAYSQTQDILVASDKTGIESWQGGAGKMLWTKNATGVGFKGHPENLWDKVILWNDRIIDQRGPGKSYDLATGKSNLNLHPITGNPFDWQFTKVGHHCNYAVAGEHLMTFRAKSAGYLDLKSGGTSRLQGFRSGCRNSLIPANGVLNAPNYANGCICSYSLFTSLAFVHNPDTEKWSYSAIPKDQGPIANIGINLGAPGDRMDESGTLWLDYPSIGGASPDVKVSVKGKKLDWFRQHSSKLDAKHLPWVASSGVEGLEQFSIQLDGKKEDEQEYQVTLLFVEPKDQKKGDRVFDVLVGDQVKLSKLDIASESAGKSRTIKKQFTAKAKGELVIKLKSRSGRTILSGVKVSRVKSSKVSSDPQSAF